MKHIVFSLVLAAACAGLADAQNRPLYKNPKDVRPGNVDSTTRIINDCESRTNRFKKTLDKALARDNVRAGQGREDQLNRNAERLENQLDRVGDSWNKDHSIPKTKDHVRAAIAVGNDINKAMRSWNMGGDAENEWAAIRSELNRLADVFNTPRIR